MPIRFWIGMLRMPSFLVRIVIVFVIIFICIAVVVAVAVVFTVAVFIPIVIVVVAIPGAFYLWHIFCLCVVVGIVFNFSRLVNLVPKISKVFIVTGNYSRKI